MRLALIIYGSLDTISGGYLYDRKLVEGLRRAGHSVEIVSLPWRSYLRHLGDNISSSLLRRLAGLEVDLLLQDELNHPSLFLLNRRLRRQGVKTPFVTIVHHLRSSEAHPAWQKVLYRAVERSYLSSVDGFIFNSRTTGAEVGRALAPDFQPIGRSIVAYPAADHLHLDISDEEILRRACQPGPLRLLFVGNLIRRKGASTLLEALAKLPQNACRLTIVGDKHVEPAYARMLLRQAGSFGLWERVRFTGRLSESELTAVLHDSHILVVPSTYEGFGIVYLEGMGFGLPAVAAAAGAAGEVITPGKDGFLIQPGDSRALAACLGELAADRERLGRMGLAARRRYLAHPTWEQASAQVAGFLSRMGR